MKTVSFTRKIDGNTKPYEFLEKLEQEFAAELPNRLMQTLGRLEHSLAGYQVSRLEHSLQSATRAYRDGRSSDYVAAALLHDIGDELAPFSRSETAASILRPFVEHDLYQIVQTHRVFQEFYYGEQTSLDRNARERFINEHWYNDAIEFCEKYDQNCFDPAYESEPLEFFQPIVQEVFSRAPRFTAKNPV